ncbi:hypothetical protein H2198_010162 [Neophaeococcomyces mojaviensis]|uniref:Uncharacterized protein n=1 Tax=Neophaeococcomyces mojaviensis TaxID=3383035 RepID=A0ACC2ZSE7_9EURO|nr:hypothetical protein H2198_010162 [Knufia sp. JES_112]
MLRLTLLWNKFSDQSRRLLLKCVTRRSKSKSKSKSGGTATYNEASNCGDVLPTNIHDDVLPACSVDFSLNIDFPADMEDNTDQPLNVGCLDEIVGKIDQSVNVGCLDDTADKPEVSEMCSQQQPCTTVTSSRESVVPSATLVNPAISSRTSSTISLSASKPLRFLDLPPEIRLRIYEVYFECATISIKRGLTMDFYTVTRLGSSFFGVLRVCRQIYAEAKETMYTRALFDLAKNPKSQKRIASRDVPDDVLARIQRIACADVGLARTLWERKMEMKLLDTGPSRIGKVYALREMVVYMGNDLLFGLTQPEYTTEKWYKDDDYSFGRCCEIVKLREFLEDVVNNGARMRLRLRTFKKVSDLFSVAVFP